GAARSAAAPAIGRSLGRSRRPHVLRRDADDRRRPARARGVGGRRGLRDDEPLPERRAGDAGVERGRHRRHVPDRSRHRKAAPRSRRRSPRNVDARHGRHAARADAAPSGLDPGDSPGPAVDGGGARGSHARDAGARWSRHGRDAAGRRRRAGRRGVESRCLGHRAAPAARRPLGGLARLHHLRAAPGGRLRAHGGRRVARPGALRRRRRGPRPGGGHARSHRRPRRPALRDDARLARRAAPARRRQPARPVPAAVREPRPAHRVAALEAPEDGAGDRAAVAVPPAPPPAPVTRERWAVIVGAGRYDNRAIPPLRFAAADAEAMYKTLVEVAGFKRENVILMTERTERKPTLRNLRQVLGTFLARAPKKEDTVVIFFAGHGAPEVDPRGAERDGLAKYLVPVDADPDDLYATALPMEEIRTIFERIEAERVVVFLDTCYSGAAGGRTFAAKGVRAGAVDELFLDRLGRAKGRAIITASRPSEVSLELAELGHGIFTYYLTRGLA